MMTPYEINLGETLSAVIGSGKIHPENLKALRDYKERYKEAMKVKPEPKPHRPFKFSIALTELVEMTQFADDNGTGDCKAIVVEVIDEAILTSYRVYSAYNEDSKLSICDINCV